MSLHRHCKVSGWKSKQADEWGLNPVLIKFEVMIFFCKFWGISKKNSLFEIWNLEQKFFMPLWSASKCSVKNKNVTEAANGDVL